MTHNDLARLDALIARPFPETTAKLQVELGQRQAQEILAARNAAPPSPPLHGDEAGSSTATESNFMPDSMVQWAWDSQGLGTAMECPRKYFYSQVLGLRRKRNVKSASLGFGGAFHKGLEVYELAKGKGLDQASAAKEAVEAAMAEAGDMPEHKNRTPESLQRSLAAYIAHHEAEQMESVLTREGKPAVELRFQTALGNINGIAISYCGYIDRVVNFQGMPYVMDHKTTGMSISTEKGSASYFSSFTPDNQFTGYAWAARAAYGFPVRGVILDAMQVAKTKTEFARNIIHRTPAQVDEWRLSALTWMRQTVAYAGEAMTKTNPLDQASCFPMNTRACHGKYSACTFAGVCGKDPAVRQNFLEADFEVERWNPLTPRQSGTLKEVGEDVAPDE